MSLRQRVSDWLSGNEQRSDWSPIVGQQRMLETHDVRHGPENLSTVLACVTAISTAIASLPAYVYRRETSGRSIDEAHPVARLLRNGPNARQSWPDWVEWTMAQALLRGNALSEVLYDGAGRVSGLLPIPWSTVSVRMLPSGRLAYDVMPAMYSNTSYRPVPRTLLEGEVFHLRDRTDDGVLGRSRLSRAPAVVNTGLEIQQFAGALYANGTRPSGLVKVEKSLERDEAQKLRNMWNDGQHVGSGNAGRVVILGSGATFERMSFSPEDAELLDSRKFSVEELCRIFNTPPPIVQDYSHNTFTNSETAGRWFAQFTLTPWIRKIEAEFGRSVFGAAVRGSLELELDLGGFMRGDYAARWQAHKIAVEEGILNPNEIREVEGWNPRAGGEVFRKTPGKRGTDDAISIA